MRGGDADDDPVFDAFWAELTASGQQTGGDAILAPNGTLVDLEAAAETGPVYDAAAIDSPTLVLRGALDTASTRRDALALFDGLDVSGDAVDYVELAGGTHFVHLERRREAVYETVRSFQSRYD